MAQDQNTSVTPLSWNALKLPSGGAILKCQTDEGRWKINPARDHQPAALSYCLGDDRKIVEMMAAEQAANPAPGSYEYWRFASLRGTDLDHHGYAETQEDAIALIELLRSGDISGNVTDLLLAGGFSFKYTVDANGKKVDIFERKVDRAYFSISLSEAGSVHLIFEKTGWNHWENLCRFASKGETYKGEPVPVFWPDRIAENFGVLTARACLAMVDRYIADGRNKRRARK